MRQTSSAEAGASEILDNQVEIEKLRLLYSSAKNPILSLAGSALIVALVLYLGEQPAWVLPWLGVHLLVSGGRLWLLRQFRIRQRLPLELNFWTRAYILSLAGISLMWGWVALMFDPDWGIGEQIIVLTFLIGICAAGGLSHAFHLPAYMALLIPILVPLFVRLLTIPDLSYILLGAGALVFSAYMALLSRRFSSTTSEFIELRFRNQDLVENLSAVNEDLQREVAEHTRALEALAGRSRVLERLARGEPLQQILDTLILSMEQILPGMRAMIMRLDEDGRHLRFVSGPNLSERFVRLVDGTEATAAAGTCGNAVVQRKRIVVDDIAEHAPSGQFVDLAQRHGFVSSWSEPIMTADGLVLGTLTIYHRNPPQYGAFDLDFIQTSTQLAGIAIERKNTEAALEQSHRLLEERVEERTSELRHMVREVESFNYSVSHDLRSPLRAIDGYSQILIEDFIDDLPPTARDYLLRCRMASQRMGQLIDGLLKLSRMSRKDLERRWINFSEICDDIVERLNATAPQRKVEWRVQRGIVLWADPTLIEAVADNLLGNAWKFTASEVDAVIEIGAKEVDKTVQVWIRDNGAGFEMEYVDKLFKPFQRLHDESRFKGTGIGLATVERIVKRHLGRIWAEGRPDAGACFTFCLPLSEASPQYPLLTGTD